MWSSPAYIPAGRGSLQGQVTVENGYKGLSINNKSCSEESPDVSALEGCYVCYGYLILLNKMIFSHENESLYTLCRAVGPSSK